MATGFISVSHSGVGNIDYYLREGECLEYKHYNGLADKSAIKTAWLDLERTEKLGNKDLNIRGRHDARVRTNYILSMPNELQASECISRTESLINKTPIKDCTYTIVVHKGEKDGIVNQHVHLLVNERSLTTFKKDRLMQRKEWLQSTFRPLFVEEFAAERAQGNTYEKRERVQTALYQADPQKAKQGIEESQVVLSVGAGAEETQQPALDRLTAEQWVKDLQQSYEEGLAKKAERLALERAREERLDRGQSRGFSM